MGELICKLSIFSKGLVLLQLNKRKTNIPVKKWAKNFTNHFSKKDIQLTNKHWKDAQHQWRNANQD